MDNAQKPEAIMTGIGGTLQAPRRVRGDTARQACYAISENRGGLLLRFQDGLVSAPAAMNET